MDTTAQPLPPSLAVTPNIPLRNQTSAQLLAERAHWQTRVEKAAGPASAAAASDFRRACNTEIATRRLLDPDSVPNGWIPERFLDEGVPPHRPTPTDWIADATDEGAIVAGCDDDTLGAADETRFAAILGEIVPFCAYTDLGSAEITVHADGTWLSADSVSRFANCFTDEDGDIFAVTMDEFASQLLEVNRADAPVSALVNVYRWGDPVPFVLASTPERGRAFLRASTETPS